MAVLEDHVGGDQRGDQHRRADEEGNFRPGAQAHQLAPGVQDGAQQVFDADVLQFDQLGALELAQVGIDQEFVLDLRHHHLGDDEGHPGADAHQRADAAEQVAVRQLLQIGGQRSSPHAHHLGQALVEGTVESLHQVQPSLDHILRFVGEGLRQGAGIGAFHIAPVVLQGLGQPGVLRLCVAEGRPVEDARYHLRGAAILAQVDGELAGAPLHGRAVPVQIEVAGAQAFFAHIQQGGGDGLARRPVGGEFAQDRRVDDRGRFFDRQVAVGIGLGAHLQDIGDAPALRFAHGGVFVAVEAAGQGGIGGRAGH